MSVTSQPAYKTVTTGAILPPPALPDHTESDHLIPLLHWSKADLPVPYSNRTAGQLNNETGRMMIRVEEWFGSKKGF